MRLHLNPACVRFHHTLFYPQTFFHRSRREARGLTFLLISFCLARDRILSRATHFWIFLMDAIHSNISSLCIFFAGYKQKSWFKKYFELNGTCSFSTFSSPVFCGKKDGSSFSPWGGRAYPDTCPEKIPEISRVRSSLFSWMTDRTLIGCLPCRMKGIGVWELWEFSVHQVGAENAAFRRQFNFYFKLKGFRL